jgi:hypothetical protein
MKGIMEVSVIDDVTNYVSRGGQLPDQVRGSLSQIAKAPSDSVKLSKLQRVASEQLAAFIVASQSKAEFPPLEDCDMQQDDNGRWMKFQDEWVRASESYNPRKCYKVITTLKQRLARHAIEYAKALLEMTE